MARIWEPSPMRRIALAVAAIGLGVGGVAQAPNWAQVMTANSPIGRAAQAMTYDSARGKVVVFGGRNASLYFSDTWEYDGVD